MSENSFINAISNTTYTENGALTNVSTLNACLDWFYHGAAKRNAEPEEIYNLFNKAFNEDPTSALRTLFYIRDIRGGQGERDVFRNCITSAINDNNTQFINWLSANLPLISEYGRFDDYEAILYSNNEELKNATFNYLQQILLEDLNSLNNNESVSLLGKWLPSEQASDKKKRLARIFAKKWNLTRKQYRTYLSKLRKKIKIVETDLTNKTYSNIEYSAVPSNAMTKYHSLFMRKDGDRFNSYLEDVKSGKTKINSSTLYPYDIVRKYITNYYNISSSSVNDTLEEQWKALPDYVPEINGLVVCDTSGSMTWGGKSVLHIHVSTSLALYVAERNKSEIWRNMVIPFSSHARFIKTTKNTLLERLGEIYTGDCSNTDLQAVFDLILGVATSNNVPASDMPKVLIVISDMEFDLPSYMGLSTSNYASIKQKYAEHGYDLPNIVWWNVDSREQQTPITINDKGNILVSGCSASVLKTVLTGEFDAVEAMNRVINQERYEKIVFDK